MADEAAATAAPVETAVPPSVMGEAVAASPVVAPVEGAAPVVEAEKVAAPVVPESYEFAAPDGVTVNAEHVTAFNDVAKAAGLTQEQYKAVMDHAIARDQATVSAPIAAWHKLQGEWKSAVFGDPSLGDGKGLIPEVSSAIARVNQQFGSPELMKALETTGAGNNPDIIRFFAKIGRALGDAGSLQFGKPAQQTQRGNSIDEIAARLYPSMQQGA